MPAFASEAPIVVRSFCVLLICALSAGRAAGQAPAAGDVAEPAGTALPLYGTWEVARSRTLTGLGNPFDMEAAALEVQVEGPDGQRFDALGFYDGPSAESGTGIWRARIMPDAPGTWCARLSWSDAAAVAAARCIDVSADAPPGNHGHVGVHPDIPTRLVHDDGTLHYWIGGKWFAPHHYVPCDLHDCYSDTQFLEYLDLLEEYSHNGILVELALFPLLDDGLTWNLAMLHRAEWLMAEAGRRGIYVQINLFNTWSRTSGAGLETSTDASRHVLNAWTDSRLAEKRNYLRTAVARFAGFFNVYWELGNEMEHSPNCGACFVALANRYYLPWLREADPYDLPIGLSEGIWLDADVDVGFLHQANRLPDPTWQKPTIMNELVRGGTPPSLGHLWSKGLGEFATGIRNYRAPAPGLWADATIRDPWYRYDYRRTFWQVLTSGGSGASEATWLSLSSPLTDAVVAVMTDHAQLAAFLARVRQDLPRLTPAPDGFELDGVPGDVTMLGSPDGPFIAYVAAGHSADLPAGEARLRLPNGTYRVQWLNPRTLEVLEARAITVAIGAGAVAVRYPAFREDIVLLAQPAD